MSVYRKNTVDRFLRHYTPIAWKIFIFPAEIGQRAAASKKEERWHRPPGYGNAKLTKMKELKLSELLQDLD